MYLTSAFGLFSVAFMARSAAIVAATTVQNVFIDEVVHGSIQRGSNHDGVHIKSIRIANAGSSWIDYEEVSIRITTESGTEEARFDHREGSWAPGTFLRLCDSWSTGLNYDEHKSHPHDCAQWAHLNFNGNDAIELVVDGNVVDLYGSRFGRYRHRFCNDLRTDLGRELSIVKRKPDVCNGNTKPWDSFNKCEWNIISLVDEQPYLRDLSESGKMCVQREENLFVFEDRKVPNPDAWTLFDWYDGTTLSSFFTDFNDEDQFEFDSKALSSNLLTIDNAPEGQAKVVGQALISSLEKFEIDRFGFDIGGASESTMVPIVITGVDENKPLYKVIGSALGVDVRVWRWGRERKYSISHEKGLFGNALDGVPLTEWEQAVYNTFESANLTKRMFRYTWDEDSYFMDLVGARTQDGNIVGIWAGNIA